MTNASPIWTANWQPATCALDLISRAARTGIKLRLIGSVAIKLRCEAAGFPFPAGDRKYGDADLICGASQYHDVRGLIVSTGFESDRTIEVTTEGRRLLFNGPDYPFTLDLFVDELIFCHRLDVRDRLAVDEVTLPLADLLLSKLQRVDLRDLDLQDVTALAAAFPLGRSDGEYINLERITSVLGADWGFCHTVLANLARMQTHTDESGLDDQSHQRAAPKFKELCAAILDGPKTWRWKLRSIAGEHLSWYQTVDAPNVF